MQLNNDTAIATHNPQSFLLIPMDSIRDSISKCDITYPKQNMGMFSSALKRLATSVWKYSSDDMPTIAQPMQQRISIIWCCVSLMALESDRSNLKMILMIKRHQRNHNGMFGYSPGQTNAHNDGQPVTVSNFMPKQ